MTQISRFTERCVAIAEKVMGDGGDTAAATGGGGFADAVLLSLYCLWIYLDASYRMMIDLLREMPRITGETGFVEADLPRAVHAVKTFDRIDMEFAECC